MQKSFGKIIREQRDKLGLQLNDVAKACDVTPSFISDLERNRSSPSVKMVQKLSEYYAIPYNDLIVSAVFFQLEKLSNKYGIEQVNNCIKQIWLSNIP